METEKSPDSKNTPEQKEYAIGVTISYYRAVGGKHITGLGRWLNWEKCLPCKHEDMSASA